QTGHVLQTATVREARVVVAIVLLDNPGLAATALDCLLELHTDGVGPLDFTLRTATVFVAVASAEDISVGSHKSPIGGRDWIGLPPRSYTSRRTTRGRTAACEGWPRGRARGLESWGAPLVTLFARQRTVPPEVAV